ncbi:MAG: hypothetical protein ABS948_05480 [Solibacillus sp.]
MRENVMYTVMGYIVFAIVFFPLLVFKHALWVGVVVLITIIGSILFGQCVKVMVRSYRQKHK